MIERGKERERERERERESSTSGRFSGELLVLGSKLQRQALKQRRWQLHQGQLTDSVNR
jgi:hypothetical protein